MIINSVLQHTSFLLCDVKINQTSSKKNYVLLSENDIQKYV